MSRRSLLIDSASLVELRLDGPALYMRGRGRSRQWFPLRRLSRIVCVELPAVGMEALMGTAAKGIPVSFFTRGGRMIAQLIHPGALPEPMPHWLDALAGDPDLQRVYDQWLDNQLRHAYALVGCVARTPEVAARRAEEQLARLVRKYDLEELVEESRSWIEGLLITRIQEQCLKQGLSLNSSHVAMIIGHLQEAGITLCLTWLVVHVRDYGPVGGGGIAACFEGELAHSVDRWLARALFTLSQQLECQALHQDAPLVIGR